MFHLKSHYDKTQVFSTELQCNVKLTALTLYQDMNAIFILDNLYL